MTTTLTAKMFNRTIVTEHATIAEARERVLAIATAQQCTIEGNQLVGKFIPQTGTRGTDGTYEITTYTKAEAKAADAELAKLTDVHYAASDRLQRAKEIAFRAAGANMAFLPGGKGLSLDGRTRASLDDVRAVAAGEREPGRWGDRQRTVDAVAKVDEAVVEVNRAASAVTAWDKENYQGWQRFFLVPDGHIHASTGCSSLRITTRIGWLPELSGETEAEAVAAHGAMLCTKCFPSAPVEWTRGKADDPTKCSGHPDPATRRGRYASCKDCGYTGALTTHGGLRKHKRAS